MNYKEELHELQVELVKLQKTIIKTNSKILAMFEGGDAGGKDGAIKCIIEHLSSRETSIVALGKSSDLTPGAFNAIQPIFPLHRKWCYSIAGGKPIQCGRFMDITKAYLDEDVFHA